MWLSLELVGHRVSYIELLGPFLASQVQADHPRIRFERMAGVDGQHPKSGLASG